MENESESSCSADAISEYDELTLQKQGQMIVPHLFLGPLQITENILWLQHLGIDCILSILGFDQDAELTKTVVAGWERVWVCVEDRVAAADQMLQALPEATERLHNWISRDNKTVYVHCQSGISRSATVVIAYLMKYHRLELMEAYGLVHRARPVINPNDGFFRVLQDFSQEQCGADYSHDEERRERERAQYNAYQLVAQLSFTGVTLESAQQCLDRYGGDLCMAANSILTKFEKSNL